MLYPDDGVRIAATVNISSQPPWGPAGYDHAPYYYFPDFNFYYDVDRAMFHYYSRGRWIAARQLPKVGYPRDLYKFYKVVIDTRDPWLYNSRHKRMYRKYKGIHTQPVLRDRPDRHTPPEHRNPVMPEHRRPMTPDRRHDTPPRDDRRDGTPAHRPGDRPVPSRNTVRDSRNNNTGAVQVTGNGSRTKPTGPDRKSNATAKRKTATTRTADKDKDKNKKTDTGKRENARTSGSRSAGSRGR